VRPVRAHPRVDEQAARTAPLQATEVETPLDTAIAAAVRAEDAEPASAAVAAAAAITARLNALLHEEAPASKAEPETEPLVGAPLPPAEDQPIVFAGAAEESAAEPDPTEALADLRPAMEPPPPLMFRAPSVSPFARRRKKPAPASALVLMGLTGLGVAGAGPIWGFSVNAPGHSPIIPDAPIAGVSLGLVGAGLLAASVYMLLARLAGQSE